MIFLLSHSICILAPLDYDFLLACFTLSVFMQDALKLGWGGNIVLSTAESLMGNSQSHIFMGCQAAVVSVPPRSGWDGDETCSLLSSLARERKRRISEKGLRWK